MHQAFWNLDDRRRNLSVMYINTRKRTANVPKMAIAVLDQKLVRLTPYENWSPVRMLAR